MSTAAVQTVQIVSSITIADFDSSTIIIIIIIITHLTLVAVQ
jgi:hypothetical protein